MSTISDKVLNKIKKEQIKPLPIWQFRLRDGGQWVGFGLFVLLIILALGLLWFFWSEGPWLHDGRFGFGLFFGRMPLILLGVIILGGLLALFDFQNLGRGYRYSFAKIALVLLFFGIVLGGSLNYFGASRRMDRFFSSSPLYQDRESYMREAWLRPNDGLLAGEIIDIRDKDNFRLRDFNGKNWAVDANGAVWRRNLQPMANLRIKLTGMASGNNFKAKEVRPWMMVGGCAMTQETDGCQMMR